VAPSTITSWVENHRLTRVHAGVYAVGHTARPHALSMAGVYAVGHTARPHALSMAAVLACGPGYLTVRITKARLTNNPTHEAARLRRILERRRLQAA
jgi:hypothetical protein